MRVLVVEDELALQKLIVRGLVQQGFSCDTANDGVEAEQQVARTQYDAVITDLKMPNKHGHALAVHLLTLSPRPVIVVHTSVVEPKLAKDLLVRGVDDILFKPFDFSLLAAKVKALVERKQAQATNRMTSPPLPEQVEAANLLDDSSTTGPVSLAHIESRLAGLSRLLPISTAGIDVYNMTGSDQWDSSQIAAAIQRDATLTADVLRMANSAFYNPSGQRIGQLDRAVIQIGQKRIGEVALATNALTSLTANLVPWMNIPLTWRRSMAAGLAVEMLMEDGKHHKIERGLFLSAIMHPLGRIVLGTLYPRQYDTMIQNCRHSQNGLSEEERRMFPLDHAGVMALLLASWGLPPEICLPLKHIFADSESLNKLPEPTRTKAELLSLAIYVANLAVNEWETWDMVDLPPISRLKKHGIDSLTDLLGRTRRDVVELAAFRADRPEGGKPLPPLVPARELAYCDLTGGTFDFLGEIVTSMGVKLVRLPEDDLRDYEDGILVNCLGVAPQRLVAKASRSFKQALTIVTETDKVEKYGEYGRAVALPISYGRLRAICWSASHAMLHADRAGSSLSVLA